MEFNQDTQSSEVTQSTPSHFLKSIIGKDVIVKLNNGFEYHGRLTTLDPYLNLILENDSINKRLLFQG